MPILGLSALVGLATLSQWTLAQQLSAECAPDYRWAFNAQDQSPCLVASYLRGMCDGPFYMSPLQPGMQYTGPTSENANSCECSSVVYTLVSACADCQSKGFQKWSSWRANCPSASNNSFLDHVPPDTVVPGWAFSGIDAMDTYNATTAKAIATASTINNQTSEDAPHVGSGTHYGPSSQSKPTNIAGLLFAVFGGVGLFAIVGALVLKQHRNRYNGKKREPPEPDHASGKVLLVTSEYYGSLQDVPKTLEEARPAHRPLSTILGD